MKAVRPIFVATAGPAILGLAVALGAGVALPESRDLHSFGWALAVGAVAGLVIFGPLAGMLAVGARRTDWLNRYSGHISVYSSVAMALSLGYLAACMYHGVSDGLMLVAMAVVLFGAIVKMGLHYALRQEHRDTPR